MIFLSLVLKTSSRKRVVSRLGRERGRVREGGKEEGEGGEGGEEVEKKRNGRKGGREGKE